MALLLIWLRKSCKHVWWPSERIHCELPHVEGFSWWWKMLPGWTRHNPSAFGDKPCASHLRPPRRRISLKPRPAMTGFTIGHGSTFKTQADFASDFGHGKHKATEMVELPRLRVLRALCPEVCLQFKHASGNETTLATWLSMSYWQSTTIGINAFFKYRANAFKGRCWPSAHATVRVMKVPSLTRATVLAGKLVESRAVGQPQVKWWVLPSSVDSNN